MNKTKKLVWGLCFILIGVILGLNTLNILDFNIFFKGWWTLFIIIPSLVGLWEKEFFGNIIGLLIGVSLLSASQGWISYGTIAKLIFPVTLVIIGISIIIKESFKNNELKKIKIDESNPITAIFSSQRITPTNEYKGNNVEAIFGSIELDLREAKINKESLIKISAIFGGVTVLLPTDVCVKVTRTAIFGGIDNKVKEKEDKKKTIYIDATAVFGGVEIK